MDARELVRWNHAVRLRFARFFESQPWSVLSEDRGASNGSIASIFMHGANMEDWWLHHVIAMKEWDGPRFDGFKDAVSMRRRVEEVNARTEALISGLKDSDLERKVDLSGAGTHGPKSMSLGDLLVEVVAEDTHHRGEILAQLWMRDIEPPEVSFLAWAAARPRPEPPSGGASPGPRAGPAAGGRRGARSRKGRHENKRSGRRRGRKRHLGQKLVHAMKRLGKKGKRRKG